MARLNIRRLALKDLEFADGLRAAEGWNQTLTDWQRLLEHQPQGCFLATWDGSPAGTATTTIHGKSLAWIGMMLVHPDYRRLGIATALIEHCLAYLEMSGVECIKLDATPAGQPVYERLGFQSEWIWERRVLEGEPMTLAPSQDDDAFQVPSWDEGVFGADRKAWLKRLAAGARIVSSGTSYGMLRAGTTANYLGPVAALDAPSAEEVIRELLLRHAPVGRCIWDIPTQNTAGVELAESLGFHPIRVLNRMWIGSRLIRGRPELQFGYADPGTG